MIARLIANMAALALATYLVPGISVSAGSRVNDVLTLAGVAVIFGIVNTIVKPLFKLVTGLVIVLTLGLFLLVINGLLLELVSWLCSKVGLGWHVADWGAAFWGALIVSIVSVVLNAVFTKRKERR